MALGTTSSWPKGWYQLWQYKVVVPAGSPPQTRGTSANNGFAAWVYATLPEAQNLATLAGRLHPCDQPGLARCRSQTMVFPGQPRTEIKGIYYSLFSQDGALIAPGKLSLFDVG